MACSAWKLYEENRASQHVERSRDFFARRIAASQRWERTWGFGNNSRSLLASEALEDNLGLGVDPQVLDSAGVRTSLGAVGPPAELAQHRRRRRRRAQLSGKGLHCVGRYRPKEIGKIERNPRSRRRECEKREMLSCFRNGAGSRM